MKKSISMLLIGTGLLLALSGCGSQKEGSPSGSAASEASQAEKSSDKSAQTETTAAAESRSISYLNKEYTVPAQTDKIVITGSFESMEDSLVLDVKPVGASTVGGSFPPMFASITERTEGIGEKTQPNLESILGLKPDVILASTKFPAETLEKLGKLTTTIPVSHISTDWKANLNLLAELTGKQEQAKQALAKYDEDLKSAREKLGPVLKDKTILVVRIRTGSIFVYPQDVFFNPSLYEELGASVPDEITKAKAQQQISLEKLSEINPDVLFVQFSEDENKETPKAFDDLQNNPIWKSLNAAKNGHVFLNLVDPLAQGGTAYSKISFLDAVMKSKLAEVK